MKVLFLASEVVPYAKTGGLADVAGSLPKVLADSLQDDVRCFLPMYKGLKDKFNSKEVAEVIVPIGDLKKKGIIREIMTSDSTKARFYFIENDEYYNREGLYTDADNEPYIDNDARFIFFVRASLAAIKAMNWKPDVIHCNDWHTGLLPAYLKTHQDYVKDPFYNDIATVYSIHNIGGVYQGKFNPFTIHLAGYGYDVFYPESPFEFYGQINFMKLGLIYADILNTVSEKYAEEIQTKEYGEGLEGVLQVRSSDLYGVINGIDYSVWNPEIDTFIKAKYNKDDISGKVECKKNLLEENGLSYHDDVPVIGIISRLATQKGFDLIKEVANEILSMDVQMVVLGTGEPDYEKFFSNLGRAYTSKDKVRTFIEDSTKNKYADKISSNIMFDNALSHKIEAGADMFLMPSRYEPCGLNQLYSLKYGTIPIVRATGGLADTVKDYTSNPDEGYGFVFESYNAGEMLDAIKRAVETYKDRKLWKEIMKRAMSLDFSWDMSARKYQELYKRAIEKVKS